MKQERLVKIRDIPETLRCALTNYLRLPKELVSSWITLLDKNGVRTKAESEPSKLVAGGLTKEATDEHLAWRFTGSAARVELAMLSPNNNESKISDAFAKIFSGGKVLLADVPCGSGAATLSVLTTIAELRAQNVLPRLPLEVVLVGGEIEEHARNNFLVAVQEVKNHLERQSITINETVMPWDVCNQLSNTDLIRQLTLLGKECSTKILLLANFSEFLQGDGKWKVAQPQFDELFRHFRGEKSSAIWIEPQTNKALPFLNRIVIWLGITKFANLFIAGDDHDAVFKDNCMIFNALDDSRQFRTQLAVIRVDLDI